MSGPGTSPYTAPAIAGYNATPPADDGSEVEANRGKWSTIKTKLADPVKTLAEADVTASTAAFAKTLNTDDGVKNDIGGNIGFESDELTIADGSVTPNRSHHTVDTEEDAASDDLDTVDVTNMATDAILILRAAHTDRTVVVKHGTDNIYLANAADYELDDTSKSIILQRRGDDFYELTRDQSTSKLLQAAHTETGAVATGTTLTPDDDTIPQSGEGDQYMTLAITPKNAASTLVISITAIVAHSAVGRIAVALFKDADTGAIAAARHRLTDANEAETITFTHKRVSGGTTEITFKVRIGNDQAGTTTFNGDTGGRLLGGVLASSINILEIAP